MHAETVLLCNDGQFPECYLESGKGDEIASCICIKVWDIPHNVTHVPLVRVRLRLCMHVQPGIHMLACTTGHSC